MIHKKLVQQKIKEFEIQSFVRSNLKGVGLSSTKLQITPLGEKIVVRASRPGLIVGRQGQSIKKLTSLLKKEFNLDNPQIEIDEVKDGRQDAEIVAESIASYLERFGSQRFKSIGHRVLEDAMNAGALGIEIVISGKVPSSRAKTWRFYQGYLKKCGDIAVNGVDRAYTTAHLKTGAIGIQVRIMPKGIELPDNITVKSDEPVVEEVKSEDVAEEKTEETTEKKEKKATTKKKTVKKKATKKKAVAKKEEKVEEAEEESTEAEEKATEEKAE